MSLLRSLFERMQSSKVASSLSKSEASQPFFAPFNKGANKVTHPKKTLNLLFIMTFL